MSISNTALNNIIINNKHNITLENYKNINIITPTNTIEIDNIPFTYNNNLKVLFCKVCVCNLTNTNYLKHLQKNHKTLYNILKNNKTLENIKNNIHNLELANIETLKNNIENNTFYFKELIINFKGFKCLECFKVDINKKNIKMHFNKRHIAKEINKNTKAYYIIDNIPLQVLEGFKNNEKVYFIPKIPITAYTSNNNNINNNLNSSSTSDSSSISFNSISSNTRNEILLDYNNNTNITNLEASKITNINNTKLQNSFIKKSNIALFLENKNRDILVDLVYNIKNNIEFNINIEFDLLEELLYNYLNNIHSKINIINIDLRQYIKNENSNKRIKEFKDFIQLETRNTQKNYFNKFIRLITFIIKVNYIINNFEFSNIELEQEYYNTFKNSIILEEIKTNINNLFSLNLIESNKNNINLELFEVYINNIYKALIEFKNLYNISTNTLNNNIVIIYYFSNLLNKDNKDIKAINTLGQISSIFIYNTRLITFGIFNINENNTINTNKEIHSNIINFINYNLTNTSNNYFAFINSLRPYLLALSKETTNTNYNIIENTFNIIEYNSNFYNINSFKEFFNYLLNQLENILLKDLLFINDINSLNINFNNIEDLTNLTINYSILNNIEFKNQSNYFLKQLLTKNSIYNKRLLKTIRNKKPIFKAKEIEKYNSNINKFIDILAISLLLFSGSPLRATELNTITFKNIETKPRSLIYNKNNNMFSIITNYYKSKNITRKETNNLRFIFPYFTKLLIIYLVYITPFKDYINLNYYNNSNSNNYYLLNKDNKVLTTSNINRILKQESSRYFREPLIISSYRRIINYIIKIKLKNTIELDSISNTSDSSNNNNYIEDKQSNRSTKVSLKHYLNIGNIFNNYSNNYKEIQKVENFSLEFWNYFNLIQTKDLNTSLIKNNNNNIINTILNNYNTKHLENNIKKLYKDNTKGFINIEQKSAIVHLVNNTTILTYINKTSSGKSLLYLLLSFIYKNSIYIVLTPRKSLTINLYNKAKDLNLNPSYLEEINIKNSNLIFIDINNINTQELDNVINAYNKLNKSITIFLDEIHLFLLEENYRLKLQYLTTLLKYKANIVFISATMPNSLINLLETRFNIKNNNNIIKGDCNRNNISYNRIYIQKYTIDIITKTIANIINNIESKDNNINNKIVIFTTQIKQGLELEKRLGYKFIYSNLKEEINIEELFNNINLRVIITTSILEVGLDIQSIKYTINIEPIYSLISIIQSTGRIRNIGTSYIISKEPNKYTKENFNITNLLNSNIDTIAKFKELDKAFYTLFTIESNCLRIPFNMLLNNTINIKCLNSESPCSICYNKQLELNNLANLEEENYKENNTNKIILENTILNYYNNYCFYCLINLKNSYKHSLNSCLNFKNNNNIKTILNNIKLLLKENNIIKDNISCFNCLLPKNICLKLIKENNLELNNTCYLEQNYLKELLALFYYYKIEIYFIFNININNIELKQFLYYILKEANIYNIKTIELINIINNLNIENIIETLENNRFSLEEDLYTTSRPNSPITNNNNNDNNNSLELEKNSLYNISRPSSSSNIVRHKRDKTQSIDISNKRINLNIANNPLNLNIKDLEINTTITNINNILKAIKIDYFKYNKSINIEIFLNILYFNNSYCFNCIYKHLNSIIELDIISKHNIKRCLTIEKKQKIQIENIYNNIKNASSNTNNIMLSLFSKIEKKKELNINLDYNNIIQNCLYIIIENKLLNNSELNNMEYLYKAKDKIENIRIPQFIYIVLEFFRAL